MSDAAWRPTVADRAAARELVARLPAQLFDAHLHLYATEHIAPAAAILGEGPAECGVAEWRALVGRQVGVGRLRGGLCVPYPSRDGDRAAANRFVLQQTAGRRNHRALLLVSPRDRSAAVEALLDGHPQIAGFKVYHSLARREVSFACRPAEYLPEWLWVLADRRGLLILLHLVRDRALADPVNHRYLRAHCEHYPRAKLVLAHAARGFHARHTVAGVEARCGLNNVWFDTAAVCEADAPAAVLEAFGPRRVMWGSDFPVSHQRGRCVSLGTGFAWVTTDQLEWPAGSF
ncbi:MAG: amidohydrolase family protein, partial [Armatimonadetes bacterium]|nr:amidohydrolase family protein [Armatimonadota bacterium]